jgi:hypothetical protein
MKCDDFFIGFNISCVRMVEIRGSLRLKNNISCVRMVWMKRSEWKTIFVV